MDVDWVDDGGWRRHVFIFYFLSFLHVAIAIGWGGSRGAHDMDSMQYDIAMLVGRKLWAVHLNWLVSMVANLHVPDDDSDG